MFISEDEAVHFLSFSTQHLCHLVQAAKRLPSPHLQAALLTITSCVERTWSQCECPCIKDIRDCDLSSPGCDNDQVLLRDWLCVGKGMGTSTKLFFWSLHTM